MFTLYLMLRMPLQLVAIVEGHKNIHRGKMAAYNTTINYYILTEGKNKVYYIYAFKLFVPVCIEVNLKLTIVPL